VRLDWKRAGAHTLVNDEGALPTYWHPGWLLRELRVHLGSGWSEAPARARDYRGDLQGLRAVAVLLVALNHAGVGFLRGGYVGVDVFFVLSGFLITGLLLQGAARAGHVSFRNFYARRVRRILPAAALTLATTTIVANLLLNYVREKQIAWDGFWASLFAANIRFAHEGTNYFAQGQPPSPDQHYWSLAVEEQFYLVWPALLAITLFGVALPLRRRRIRAVRDGNITDGARLRLLVVIIVLGAASLLWSIHDTNALPAAAYFSTRARGWELALGAMLAVAAPAVDRVPRSLGFVMGWVGFAAIAVAAVEFSAATPFPGYYALLPTVGAALIIAGGMGRRAFRPSTGNVLAASPLRYVGDRSYTFYLWHWPALTIAVLYVGHQLGVAMNMLILLGAFLLSIVTYALFENPIRRARWSMRGSALLVPVSVASVIVVTMVILSSVNAKIARAERASAAIAQSDHSIFSTRSLRLGSHPLRSVVKAVRAAKRGAKLPSPLTPALSDLDKEAYKFPPGCVPTSPDQTTSPICKLGDASASKTIVVFGDSHTQMWMPTVLLMAQHDGWSVIPLVKSGCVPSAWTGNGYPNTPAPTISQCHAWFTWAKAEAKKLRPDVLLMSGCCGSANGQTLTYTKAGYSSLAAAVKGAAGQVILVADNAGIKKQPVDCLLARHATMKTCTTTWNSTRFASLKAVAKLARSRGFGYLDTLGWFCDGFKCPFVVGHTVVYRDTGHITQAYAKRLAVPFRNAFRRCLFSNCPA
jgi:peptidoglycan/LPS O-acetylase OafA/YrhL